MENTHKKFPVKDGIVWGWKMMQQHKKLFFVLFCINALLYFTEALNFNSPSDTVNIQYIAFTLFECLLVYFTIEVILRIYQKTEHSANTTIKDVVVTVLSTTLLYFILISPILLVDIVKPGWFFKLVAIIVTFYLSSVYYLSSRVLIDQNVSIIEALRKAEKLSKGIRFKFLFYSIFTYAVPLVGMHFFKFEIVRGGIVVILMSCAYVILACMITYVYMIRKDIVHEKKERIVDEKLQNTINHIVWK